MKGQASNEVRNAAAHIEMQEAKGKARTKGLPTSERSQEFKSGTQPWLPPIPYANAWDAERNRLMNPISGWANAKATRPRGE